MKRLQKINTATSMLGLTQEQLAAVLKVSRTLVTRFELHQRDLPLHAKQTLAELLLHAQSQPLNAFAKTKAQNTVILKELEKLLRENEYQQMLTERKIAALQKKQSQIAKLSHLAKFLSGKNSSFDKEAVRLILKKVQKSDVHALEIELVKLDFRKNLLRQEKKLITQKINELTKTPIK